jgi:hypothetical protein
MSTSRPGRGIVVATWSRSEHNTRHVEYRVPAEQPWGACWAQVSQAITAAMANYRELHSLPFNAPPADDWVRVFPGDGEIVIRFEVEESSGG